MQENKTRRSLLERLGLARAAAPEEIRSVALLTLRLSGMRFTSEYEIVEKEDGAELSLYQIRYGRAAGEDERLLEKRAICPTEDMLRLLNDCRLMSWDGFAGAHPKGVLDGTMFRLDATLGDGRRIYAHGSENFPRHYRELLDGFRALLDSGGAQPEEAQSDV